MTPRRPSVLWIPILLAVPACGGDSDGDADAPPGVADAPVQPTPDAPPPDGGPASTFLAGTWRHLPGYLDGTQPPIEERAVLTLDPDGTYTLVEDGQTELATYTADDRTITISGETSSGPHTYRVDYVATVDRLMFGALFPVGAADGTVGTWHGDAMLDGTGITLALELRADNTAHYERTETTGESEAYDGTWAYVFEDVVFTTMIDTVTVNVHYKEIRGVTIGGPFFERLPPAKRTAGPAPAARGDGLLDVPILAPLR